MTVAAYSTASAMLPGLRVTTSQTRRSSRRDSMLISLPKVGKRVAEPTGLGQRQRGLNFKRYNVDQHTSGFRPETLKPGRNPLPGLLLRGLVRLRAHHGAIARRDGRRMQRGYAPTAMEHIARLDVVTLDQAGVQKRQESRRRLAI